MRDIESAGGQNRAQAQSRGDIKGIANPERMTFYTLAVSPLPEPSSGTAHKLGTMPSRHKFARQGHYLGFAATELELGIDADDSQWPLRRARVTSRRDRFGLMLLNRIQSKNR